MKKLKSFVFVLIIILIYSCSSSGGDTPNNNNQNNNVQGNNNDQNKVKSGTYEINHFIWEGLNTWYLWVDEVPNLDANTFNNSQDKLDNFLLQYDNPDNFFYSLLYERGKVDRFSWIVNNYEELEKSFQGITLSTGMELAAYQYQTGIVRAYVKYVVSDSPADYQGVKRGNVITHVNGTQMTNDNYRSLLFNNSASSITFTFLNGDKTISQIEVKENPVLLVKVLNEGGKKIGYLVFNGFTSGYQTQLNDALGELATANIDELVLDLRYNGGGLVSMAVQLASSIAGSGNVGKVMAKSRYNEEIQKEITDNHGADYLKYKFTDKVNSTTPLNFLNLNRLFVLVSGGSASASELVINSLKPYMNVFLIGKKTYGKNVGSITLYDSDDFTKSHSSLNEKHKWAMQPIVFITENASGFSDYTNGFEPNITYDEFNDYFKVNESLVELGERTEPLLAKAIKEITGIDPLAKLNLTQEGLRKYTKNYSIKDKLINPKELHPYYFDMHEDVEKIPFNIRKKLIER